MKIGIEIQHILDDKTGVGWYTQNLINKFEDTQDYKFEGYAFNFMNRNNIDNQLRQLKFNNKVNYFMPYGVYRRFWRYIPVSYNCIFKSNCDLYHFFNYIIPPKIKGRIVLTVYDLVYKEFPETMDKRNLRSLNIELSRSINRADKIITISESSKQQICNHFNIEEKKIAIVYPGVDRESYNIKYEKEMLNRITNKYKLPEKYILYLGTLEPRKNIKKIIEAFYLYKKENSSNIKLVIVGKKGWMYQDIFDKIKVFNLEEEVIFTGYVDEEEKAAIYQMSKLFIFPSLYEGFGMPVLEAMAAGIPVITSNSSSLPEVAANAALQVSPLKETEISAAIKRVLNDSQLRKEMKEKGLKQSLKFDWKRSAEKLLTIYQEVGG